MRRNINRIRIRYLNMSYLQIKFEVLKEIVKGKLDIITVSETKFKQHLSYLGKRLDTLSYEYDNYIFWQTLMLKLVLSVLQFEITY